MSRSVTNVLIKHEEKMSREQAAILLESIASKLKGTGELTISVGDQSETIKPTNDVTFEIELEEKNGKYELELELEWRSDNDGPKSVTIE